MKTENIQSDELQELYNAEAVADKVVAKMSMTMHTPKFGKGSPTIKEVAEVMGKEQTFVREGVEKGWLPIGFCKMNDKNRTFFLSPIKIWQELGYIWLGDGKWG